MASASSNFEKSVIYFDSLFLQLRHEHFVRDIFDEIFALVNNVNFITIFRFCLIVLKS